MKTIHKALAITSLLALPLLAQAEQQFYKIDNSHSSINWQIRHVVSKTTGTFSDVTGQLVIDRKTLANSSVDAKINLLSVNSSNAKRDEHIKKEEYLDMGKFAEATFKSTKIEAKSDSEGVMTGQFTLHGVTKTITFPFKVLGFGNDPWGGYRVGLEANTSIKASDYGFTWPLKTNAPVGDEVALNLLLEGVQAAPAVKPY